MRHGITPWIQIGLKNIRLVIYIIIHQINLVLCILVATFTITDYYYCKNNTALLVQWGHIQWIVTNDLAEIYISYIYIYICIVCMCISKLPIMQYFYPSAKWTWILVLGCKNPALIQRDNLLREF